MNVKDIEILVRKASEESGLTEFSKHNNCTSEVQDMVSRMASKVFKSSIEKVLDIYCKTHCSLTRKECSNFGGTCKNYNNFSNALKK